VPGQVPLSPSGHRPLRFCTKRSASGRTSTQAAPGLGPLQARAWSRSAPRPRHPPSGRGELIFSHPLLSRRAGYSCCTRAATDATSCRAGQDGQVLAAGRSRCLTARRQQPVSLAQVRRPVSGDAHGAGGRLALPRRRDDSSLFGSGDDHPALEGAVVTATPRPANANNVGPLRASSRRDDDIVPGCRDSTAE